MAAQLWAEALLFAHRLLFTQKLARLDHFGGGTPLLDRLACSDATIDRLRDELARACATLPVEDLGRIHEGLLELEPGITTEPMSRLRRGRLEVVVPAARGRLYRHARAPGSKIEWLEDIEPGRFHLRVGLGRKASGSYYTPRELVRSLVELALRPQIDARSPLDDPHPAALLELAVIDPAMGSGVFLIEACRVLADALLDACRRCLTRGEAARVHALPESELLLAALRVPGRARALCRRLVAMHCLYGVDRNALAVELCRLSLAIESYVDDLPLVSLDHRLVHGDALTGPSFAHMLTRPGDGSALDVALRRGLEAARMARDPALERVAAAWAGGAMLANERADVDAAYAWLVRSIVDGLTLEAPPEPLPDMLAVGRDAVVFELRFAERFSGARQGFDAILGNPPWDKLKCEAKRFGGSFDLSILDSERKSEWQPKFDALLEHDASARAAWQQLTRELGRMRSSCARLYMRTGFQVGALSISGDRDLYMLFLQRAAQLCAPTGRCALVLSGGLIKNPAAAPWRELLYTNCTAHYTGHFHNRNNLFEDLPAILEFCIVCFSPGFDAHARIAFGLDLDDFADLEPPRETFACTAGEAVARLGELLIPGRRVDLHVERASLAAFLSAYGLVFGADLHRTGCAAAFVPVRALVGEGEDVRRLPAAESVWQRSHAALRNARSIAPYTDTPPARRGRWNTDVDLLVRLGDPRVARIAERACHVRLAFRETCGSPKTNRRSMMAALLAPRNLCSHKLFVEQEPANRPNAHALVGLAVLNSYIVDALLRPRIQTSISKSLLATCDGPGPLEPAAAKFLAHAALRLSCNHDAFAPLWTEQLGRTVEWPVLEDDVRWPVRAAIDAVVARAYGLSREGYAELLASFDHRHAWTIALCLAAFDELAAGGIEAFARRHDPDHDVPLVGTPARPVIELL